MNDKNVFKIKDNESIENEIHNLNNGLFSIDPQDIKGERVVVLREEDNDFLRVKLELDTENWMERKLIQNPDGFLINKNALEKVN